MARCGSLAPPYVPGVLLAPSPHMQQGWVVKTDQDRIVHVREAIVPSILSDQVALELQEKGGEEEILMEEPSEIRRGIVGKQPPQEGPKLPLPDPLAYGPPLHDVVEADDASNYAPTTPDHDDGEHASAVLADGASCLKIGPQGPEDALPGGGFGFGFRKGC